MQNGKDNTLISESRAGVSSSDNYEPSNSDVTSRHPILADDDMIMATAEDDHLLGLDRVEPPTLPNRKQLASIGVFVLMSISMIATGVVATVASEKKTSTLAAEQARLEESLRGRNQYFQTWIDNLLRTSRRLTESSLLRLYVGDVVLEPPDHPLPRSLLDQRPYFQTLIAEFARQNDLARATIIDENGRLLLGSSGPTLKIDDLLARVNKAPAGWNHLISPIRTAEGSGERLVVDILIPIPKAQVMNDDMEESFALLVQTFPIDSLIRSLLSVSEQRKNDERLFLVQEAGEFLETISLSQNGPDLIKLLRNKNEPLRDSKNFGQWSIFNDQSTYSAGFSLPNIKWTIIHSIEYQAVLSSVHHFVIVATSIAMMIVLIASFCFAVFWWRQTTAHHHELISLYQSLTARLSKQRQFLVAVTSSISDWLVVSREGNRCIYANSALISALGLGQNDILGRNQNDILPLRPFLPSGDSLDGVIGAERFSILEIDNEQRFITSSSSDLRGHDGQSAGTVTIMRDQTALVERRQQHVQSLTETIEAFIHAVERRDPFLLGHTSRLRSYSLAVGRSLKLDDNDLAALALAASLSQIGKIFVPDEILAKPERHVRQETEIMRSHIEHTLSILSHIDFGFPVVDILSQMHERLDGSGYPSGLKDVDIDLLGRILGAVDVFCARTAPRSYRDRISGGNALYHLANNVDRYDIRVTAVLAKVVSKEGILDPACELDGGFLDSQFWKNLDARRDSKHGVAA